MLKPEEEDPDDVILGRPSLLVTDCHRLYEKVSILDPACGLLPVQGFDDDEEDDDDDNEEDDDPEEDELPEDWVF